MHPFNKYIQAYSLPASTLDTGDSSSGYESLLLFRAVIAQSKNSVCLNELRDNVGVRIGEHIQRYSGA